MPFCTWAQVANDFTIVQQIGVDVTPPTTPAFVQVTPVASTQIDVTWGVSTDDVALGGYRLFRDAVQIATTTLTSYSDTGLTASTTYSYTVEAFDWEYRTATPTAPVSTTTPQLVSPPVTSTTTESSSGGGVRPVLRELQVTPETHGALLEWETNEYTRYTLRWGLSTSYEIGFVQSDVYQREHLTHIGELKPETTYYYQLIGYDANNRQYTLEEGMFDTLAVPDVFPPANVTGLSATVDAVAVYLSWTNPSTPDFDKVRVVRNHLFYPLNLTDGFVVYEGSAESVYESDVLIDHAVQYYTVFTYDIAGNISSGAVVMVTRDGFFTPGLDSEYVQSTPSEGGTDVDLSGSVATATTGDSVADTVSGTNLRFVDVEFWQEDQLLLQGDNNVTVQDDLPIIIRIPAYKLPKHLKTVTVMLQRDSRSGDAYILRLNNDMDAYEAQLEALPEGVYPVRFSLYDFRLKTQTAFSGEVISASHKSYLKTERESFWSLLTAYEKWVIYALIPSLLFLLCLWWFIFLLRRRSEDN